MIKKCNPQNIDPILKMKGFFYLKIFGNFQYLS